MILCTKAWANDYPLLTDANQQLLRWVFCTCLGVQSDSSFSGQHPFACDFKHMGSLRQCGIASRKNLSLSFLVPGLPLPNSMSLGEVFQS